MMRRLAQSSDAKAVGLLILLWLLFFWRLLTPIPEDQRSFKQGDFSGQFVAFGAYQYERFADGELPLWNPYNNSGLPFIADTQAAVFYPPRLITIGLSILAGGFGYAALQYEAMAHVLFYSLLMYLFVRRLTLSHTGSVFGSFIAAVVAGYGGFISGYPPLQLALLEASIWLPLGTLGILEATRKADDCNWRWQFLTGFALGISWMAGHPQTSWFLTYLLIAYFGYRVYVQGYGWRVFILGTALFGVISLGVTAITFLPGVEYLSLATRSELGFDAKGNGFPIQDIAQFLFPGVVSLFSPLYVGIPALVFGFIAITRKRPQAIFWFGVVIIALIHSFGANTAFYTTIYNFVPGLRFFRGQERAAFLAANGLAILAGLGAAHWFTWTESTGKMLVRRFMYGIVGLCSIIAVLIFVLWLGNGDAYSEISIVFFSMIVAIVTTLLIFWRFTNPHGKAVFWLMGLLVIFELFSVNMDADSNYDSIPAEQRLSITAPPLVQAVLDDTDGAPFRVDGFRGLQDNYGSLYGVLDMRGISPLFLAGAEEIIYWNYVDNPIAWEIFAVKYVYSESESLSVPSQIIAEGTDRDGYVRLHQLENPRPFAHLVFDVEVLDSDEFAYELLRDERFDPRSTIILNQDTGIELPESAPEYTVDVTEFLPEKITIEVDTPENAILSLSHPDYPGWQATIDNVPTDILRAYGAVSAVVVPAGTHTIQLMFNPITYRIGAIISLITWSLVAFFAVYQGMHLFRSQALSEH